MGEVHILELSLFPNALANQFEITKYSDFDFINFISTFPQKRVIYNNTIVILTKKDFTHIVHQKVFLRNIDTYKGTISKGTRNCISEKLHLVTCPYFCPFFLQ